VVGDWEGEKLPHYVTCLVDPVVRDHDVEDLPPEYSDQYVPSLDVPRLLAQEHSLTLMLRFFDLTSAAVWLSASSPIGYLSVVMVAFHLL